VNRPCAWILAPMLCVSSLMTADADAQISQSSWNAEVSVGWDIGLSGDFLAAGIGTLNDIPVVFQSQPFDDVYGNGLMWQFSGGYMVDEINEVRAQVSYEHVGADVVNLGTAGAFGLVATFADYDAWTVEAGGRHYFAKRDERLRPYAGAAIGVSIIAEIDGVLASPQAGLARYATDFYDGTGAFMLAINGGALYALKNDRFDLHGQIGFRYNSGLSAIDALVGTGLEDVNDKSSRWTMPITFGLRVKF
jgi:hypothetical protein